MQAHIIGAAQRAGVYFPDITAQYNHKFQICSAMHYFASYFEPHQYHFIKIAFNEAILLV